MAKPSPLGSPHSAGVCSIIAQSLAFIALALPLEALLGYPQALYRAIGHPVVWIGAIISALDRHLNRPTWPATLRRLAGVLGMLLLCAGTTGLSLALQQAIRTLLPAPWSMLILVLLGTSLLAQRSLYDHVAAVARGLRDGGLEGGRKAVSMIVGRNPQTLDEAGVCRAAIESLAENFADGIVCPALWAALFGLPGLVFYKTVNTADSMIGHRTPRHEAFGWAAARLDDVINLPGARLSSLLLALAAGPRAGTAARAAWRDARGHRSPNAGWPEAAMAGALGLRLAGPRIYGDIRVEDAWMGDGTPDASEADLRRALHLYRIACALLMALAGTLALIARG